MVGDVESSEGGSQNIWISGSAAREQLKLTLVTAPMTTTQRSSCTDINLYHIFTFRVCVFSLDELLVQIAGCKRCGQRLSLCVTPFVFELVWSEKGHYQPWGQLPVRRVLVHFSARSWFLGIATVEFACDCLSLSFNAHCAVSDDEAFLKAGSFFLSPLSR